MASRAVPAPSAPVSFFGASNRRGSYTEAYGSEYEIDGDLLTFHTEEAPPGLTRAVDGTPIGSSKTDHLGVKRVEYRRQGLAGRLHRTDGPALISILDTYSKARGAGFYRDGAVVEHYALNGRFGRLDGGPTEVVRDQNGDVIAERWVTSSQPEMLDNGTNFVHSRLDGPAIIDRDATGKVVVREWKRNGKWSRIDGPAVIREGSVRPGEHYRLDGMGFDDAASFYDYVATLDAKTLADHFAGTPLARISEGREHQVVGILAQGVRTPVGVSECLSGSPPEWVRAYEEGLPE